MLHKMALNSENNGEVAAVHHPAAKKMLWLCFRTTSKWPQVPPPLS